MDVCYFVHEFGRVRGIEFGTIDCEDLGYVFVQRYVRKDNRIIQFHPLRNYFSLTEKKFLSNWGSCQTFSTFATAQVMRFLGQTRSV